MLLRALFFFALLGTSIDHPGWTVLGPGGGGAQFNPAVSPHDPKRVLVSCDMTGAYLTEDGGASLADGQFRDHRPVLCLRPGAAESRLRPDRPPLAQRRRRPLLENDLSRRCPRRNRWRPRRRARRLESARGRCHGGRRTRRSGREWAIRLQRSDRRRPDLVPGSRSFPVAPGAST